CRRVWISGKKEAHVYFLIDPLGERSTLRPADVLIFARVRGKYVCRSDWGFSSHGVE
nr:hypothetical protein [Tanacetum cinerariifolium]